MLAEVTVSAQAAERVKAQVQKVKDKAQKIVDEISVSRSHNAIVSDHSACELIVGAM